LEKDAGQVLWDYSAETTVSLSRMIKVLKERFGEANQSDKYRFELKSRRRRPNETPRNLHSDIRRLTALAVPDLEHRARETMACDYFIDALNDPNFALKVRERFPKDLDTALRVALQLEVWSKDIVDFKNFATESRWYTDYIHNSSAVGLFMTLIGQFPSNNDSSRMRQDQPKRTKATNNNFDLPNHVPATKLSENECFRSVITS